MEPLPPTPPKRKLLDQVRDAIYIHRLLASIKDQKNTFYMPEI